MVCAIQKINGPQTPPVVYADHGNGDGGVAHASVAEIDEINILQASHLAMVRAIENLPKPADFALIDGNRAPKNLIIPSTCVERG